MFKQTLFLAIVVSAVLACNVQAAVIDSNWVGGSSGSWGQASNWNPAIVPDNDGNTFIVTIHGGVIDDDPCTVQLTQNRTIDELYCYGWVVLDINGVVELKFEDPNGLINYAKLEFERDIDIIGNVTNKSGAEIAPEILRIVGNLYNESNGFLEVGFLIGVDHGNSQFRGFIENAGIIDVRPNSHIFSDRDFNNIGLINIIGATCQADKFFYNENTAAVSGFGSLYGWLGLYNEGTIYASGGSLAIISSGSVVNSGVLANEALASMHIKPAVDVVNQGRIEVNAGGGMVFDCNLVNDSNGVIKLLDGTLSAKTITQTADANLSGFGGITGDVIMEPNAVIKLTGPTNIVGDVNIANNAELEISDGTTLITGHTTCNNGTIHMIGGRIIPQGGFTDNNCSIIWEPGTYNNIADFNLDGQVNFKDFGDFANTWLWQSAL